MRSSNPVRLVSLLAGSSDPFYQAVAGYLHGRCGVAVQWVGDVDWPGREQMLDCGQARIAFLCGLLYRRKLTPALELLAAPVMQAPRYQDRPIYFADVVVSRDSPFHSLADLRGASWAYNDPASFSGHALICYELARRGETAAYFGAIRQSGSHLASLQMIIDGRVAASAIDSTVLAGAVRQRPELAAQIRIIASWGPHPSPPAVIARDLPAPLKEKIRQLLLEMHHDEAGRQIVAQGMLARFAPISDSAYDQMHDLAQTAAAVTLEQ